MEIEVRSGDEVVRSGNIKAVDFIKIDVEGYEQFVLEGLLETIKKYKPAIVFEFDRGYQIKSGHDPKEIITIFDSIQYQLFSIKENVLSTFDYNNKIQSVEILALPTCNAKTRSGISFHAG